MVEKGLSLYTQFMCQPLLITSQWSDSAQAVHLEPFTAPVGPAIPITASILETFQLFFSVALVKDIVQQTNKYAAEVLSDSARRSWTDVTEDDIWAFLGFMILMGINQLPALVDYWKKSPIFRYAPIADRISRDRFLQILRNLHFVDNSTLLDRADPGYDKLCKVRPIITVVQQACRLSFNGRQNQSIDEAMIAFKGRSSMKQYMPMKPTKRGFKVWVRSDAKNGYVCQMDFYTGKLDNTVEIGLGANVVSKLTKDLVGRHHCIYMDNFFSSYSLLHSLLEKGIYATGTLRPNRKHFPRDLIDVVKKGLPSRGDLVFRQNGNITVTVWQDKKPVV